jgi:Protein of unknown function (DUF3467)
MTDSEETQSVVTQPLQVKFTQHENFESWYANNVQFVASDWDLRMVFGEIDLPKMTVQQHTAMTITWQQAKIMHYFLMVNIGVHEMSHGKIPIVPSILPPEPAPPSGDLANDPGAHAVYEYIKQLRQAFVESLP